MKANAVSLLEASQVVSLLEETWSDIRECLGERWDAFLNDYAKIVDELPPSPSPDDVQLAARRIRRVMGDYDYTRGLLTHEEAGEAEPPAHWEARKMFERFRLAGSAGKTLPDEIKLSGQIGNRMQALAQARQPKPEDRETDEGADGAHPAADRDV